MRQCVNSDRIYCVSLLDDGLVFGLEYVVFNDRFMNKNNENRSIRAIFLVIKNKNEKIANCKMKLATLRE